MKKILSYTLDSQNIKFKTRLLNNINTFFGDCFTAHLVL